MASERPVVRGRLSRLVRMAGVGVRSGITFLGRGDGTEAAQHALEVLGSLRGLATKAGQMASYVDGFVPDAQRDAYGRLLGTLQACAPASPFLEIRAVLERELERPLAEVYLRFDPDPIASASFGQVHRAALLDGRDVVVKVQHPGVAESLEADLRSADAVVTLVSALSPSIDANAMYREIGARFREELDYSLEADRQSKFRELFASSAFIRVPEVIRSASTPRVLTMEYIRGLPYEQALTQPGRLRRRYAETLWRFAFGSLLQHGLFNADPHPGNYLFHEDGSVTFLDFGCVQHLARAQYMGMRAMHRAAMDHDTTGFRDAVRMQFETIEGAYEHELVRHLWRCSEPLRVGAYRIERAYVAALVRQIQTLKKQMFKRGANVTPAPSGTLLLHRLHFGFYSVLARFDVEVAYASIDRELLQESTASMLGELP